MIIIKIVDDLLATGTDPALRFFIVGFGKLFKLSETLNGPGRLRFFGLSIVQQDDFSCSIDGDEKLQAIEPYPLSRVHRRQVCEEMNEIESSSFMSINDSIGWLCITSSLLCAFYSSHLQQKLRDACVSALMAQSSAFNVLKRQGTLSTYIRPPSSSRNQVTLIAFADAGHADTASQLCFVIGLFYGEIKKGSVLHLLSWASHKSRRPVRSTSAAKILAAGEALDEIVLLRDVLSTILGVCVLLAVLVDSKDLYRPLSSQRHPTDKSVRGYVNAIRFYYETSIDVFRWIRMACNPGDVGTKLNSSLVETFALTAATGILHFDFESLESASKDKPLG